MLGRSFRLYVIFLISLCFPLYFFSESFLYGREILEKSVMPAVDGMYQEFFKLKRYYGIKQYQEIQSILNTKEKMVRFVTYNMRSEALQGQADIEGVYRASLPGILAVLESMQADIIAVQRLPRGLPFDEFLANLKIGKIDYDYYGTFRQNPFKGFNGIFYNANRFNLIESYKERIGDRNNPTIWLKLRDKINKRVEFWVVVFELSSSNADVREKEITILTERVKDFKIPVILMGDFHLLPSFPLEIENIRWLDGTRCSDILSSVLEDAYDTALVGHYGYTSNRLMCLSCSPFVRTDRIYLSKNKNAKVFVHGIESAIYDGYNPTERLPVFADIWIEASRRIWDW